MGIPTEITINAYPVAQPACQELIPLPFGILRRSDTMAPLPGQLITVTYNGTPVFTDFTDGAGVYSLRSGYILEVGDFQLRASYAGSGGFDPCFIETPITVEYCEGSEDLSARFWVNHFRTPNKIKEADCWGAILCIDPNGLRDDQKGPILFLVDSCVLRPGLTDKAGGFAATINDNKTSIALNGTQKRIYDMTLFEADTIYIRDNDEFWIGVQQGPVSDPWVSGTGGRFWLMGGWINKRFYTYDAQTQIIAYFEGKDYMDLWKENWFGTDGIPRNYDEPVDILQVVVDILFDMNAAQDSDWEFTGHPDNFPGSPLTVDVLFGGTTITVSDTTPFSLGDAFIWDNENYTGETVVITVIPSATQLTIASGIVNGVGYSTAENAVIVMSSDLTGVSFLKEFNNNPMFGTMQDLCERAEHEWKITSYPTGTTPAGRRTLEFYPRASAPYAGNADIRYGSNIRQLPSIMVGDTTNLVTNALVTGRPVSFPENTTDWINTRAWPDRENRNRLYSIVSTPPPPNAYSGAFADASLIFDDEINPGLNLQKDNEGIFDVYLSFYAQTADIAVATLDIDLRKWRRLKFNFRHATAESATIPLTVLNYLNLVGVTIAVTVTSVAYGGPPRVEYLVEGTDWTAATSNNATATSIQVAIDALTWAAASVLGPVVTVTRFGITGFLSYVASTAAALDLAIDTSQANEYILKLHTYNPTYASVPNLWRQNFYYYFGTGVLQSSMMFNDPVTSNHDIVKSRLWNEIDILLPDVNTDGSIGDGLVADLYKDEYMHGWLPTFRTGTPNTQDTTADPTNIDFLGINVECKERGPGGLPTDAPGGVVKSLNGLNKTFIASLALAAPAIVGDSFLNVTNAYQMAGDYMPGTGPPPTEARLFQAPYPEYVIWKNSTNWEKISIAAVAGSGGLYPGGDNVLLAKPLENAYANAELLCRGGWNISFSQLRFTPGSIDKAASLPANLANPKRFRLISSDDVEYLVDIEGLADQTLLDSAAYQAVKVTLDGDPRHRVGLRMIPYLDPHRPSAGLPTNFQSIDMVVDSAEHHIVACDFYSILVLGTIATRGKELVFPEISGQQEAKLARTSYGLRRSGGKFQRK